MQRTPMRPPAPEPPTEPGPDDSLELEVMTEDGTRSRVLCVAIEASAAPVGEPRRPR